jgi:TolB-like protein
MAIVVATLLGASAAGAPRVQLAVMDLEARSAEPMLAESASEALVGALRDLQVFKVISRAEIKQMLTLDRERSLLGSTCTESGCLAEIGSALGARFLVVGSLTGIDRQGPFSLRVQLFDMKKAEVVSDQTRGDLKTAREALEVVRTLGVAVVRPILEKEQGFLEVTCKEEGAKVSVDGRLVGISPLPVQKLGWGPHRVVVEKAGFIAWAKDVQIERNQVSAELVTMIPSPDFVESYRSRNRALRVGAWTATALAIAGAGAAAYLHFGPVEDRWQRFEPLQSAFESRSGIRKTCEEARAGLGDDFDACYRHAEELSSEGTTFQWASRGAAGVSVVAAAAAAYFWAAGDSPGRYDLFLEEKPEAPLAAIVPLRGGATATFSLGF